MKEILIVDYKINNTGSIVNAIKYLGFKPLVSDKPADILKSKNIILPGVGAFKVAMKFIKKKKIDVYLKKALEKKNTKLLGICLGMQLLCQSSKEFGLSKGLELIETHVEEINNLNKNFHDIHIGFNSVKFNEKMKLFKGLKNNSDFYFVHTYCVKNSKKFKGLLGLSKHKSKFISCFEKDNIFATQFHPEKSHQNGLKVLKNFCDL